MKDFFPHSCELKGLFCESYVIFFLLMKVRIPSFPVIISGAVPVHLRSATIKSVWRQDLRKRLNFLTVIHCT